MKALNSIMSNEIEVIYEKAFPRQILMRSVGA